MLYLLESRVLLTASDVDPSFGVRGFASANFYSSDDLLHAVTQDSQGRLIAVGGAQRQTNGQAVAVARFTPEGILDSSFSDDGKFTFDDPGNEFTAAARADARADGSLLVGFLLAGDDFGVMKINANGTLDASFGSGGVFRYGGDASPVGYRDVRAVQELPSGKILIAVEAAMEQKLALVRLNANGTLDTTFGSNGSRITGRQEVYAGNPMSVQSDGKILIAGGDGVERYSANGALDTTFGDAGTAAIVPHGPGSLHMTSIHLADNGAITLLARHDQSTTTAIETDIFRLTSSGQTDFSFSDDGRASLGSGEDTPVALLVRSDGTMLVGGLTMGGSEVYSLNASGVPVNNFGYKGVVAFPGASIRGLLAQDDKILVGYGGLGRAGDPSDLCFVRLGSDHINIVNGVLEYTGTAQADHIALSGTDTRIEIRYLDDSNFPSYFARGRVNAVQMDAGDGNDYLQSAYSNVPTTLLGGDGDDYVHLVLAMNTTGEMILNGGAGNDTLIAGNNVPMYLYGEGGNDVIHGSSVNDTIMGGGGKDMIWGNEGADRISGGGGKDRINGGEGNDRIYGGAGDDQIEGYYGRDRLYGQDGNDKLFGQTHNDTLDGGAGNDLLIGNRGDDTLFARDGEADRVDGGSGEDSAEVDDDDSLSSIQVIV